MTDRGRAGDPPQFYDAHVFVCTNQRAADHPRGSCATKDSVRLRDYMKARAKDLGLKTMRINSAGCLERCEHGVSVVIYPEGVWYTVKTQADVDHVLEAHLVKGGRATELRMPPERFGVKG
ncbi:MAG: (2Fe-2S) ferredoxin domain-containing protein [Alphaproteobacteria bacterium]|nr:(2Fe-2S) ferredoxin domain-containing protein [Alphaproteobacteria bacterium]